MSGQQQRPAMTASQITYTNTIADAVRMTIDQFHTLSPAQAAVGSLLREVAGAFMQEQTALQRIPMGTFNMLASPATCRVATTQVLRSIAEQVIERETGDEPDMRATAIEAQMLVEDSISRLLTSSGMGDVRKGLKTAREEIRNAANYVGAAMLEHQHTGMDAAHRAEYAAWCENHDLPPLPADFQSFESIRHLKLGVNDTSELRLSLLSDVMQNQMEEAVRNVFKLASAGENTTGRILAGFRLPMSVEHTLLHTPAATSSARSLREVQLAVNIIADDMQSPSGLFNAAATETYLAKLGRLGLAPSVMRADDYAQAAQPAVAYAAKVSEALTYLIEGKDGWAQRGASKAMTSSSFIVSSPNRLQ